MTLPSSAIIDYLIDGRGRRAAKKLNGIITQRFIYQSQLQVAAELTGAGSVRARFVYGSKMNVPDHMIMGGVTYKIVSDHLGSVRLVQRADNRQIVQEMTYDEFGRVLSDTNPGFQPFGFAGGIYDRDTGLVRFGSRDYDFELGRWTSKDPILFSGGDTNLYGYVLNDPVSWSDQEGTGPIAGLICSAVSGGLLVKDLIKIKQLNENMNKTAELLKKFDKALDREYDKKCPNFGLIASLTEKKISWGLRYANEQRDFSLAISDLQSYGTAASICAALWKVPILW